MSTPAESAEGPNFTITRTFDAPRDRVWRAWTESGDFAAWLHPLGVSTDGVKADVRVGGRYSYTMTNDETKETYPTGGEYVEIVPIDRLVFSWGDPEAPVQGTPLITLTFVPAGERTELTFHLRGFDGEPGDNFVYDGWDEALANLAKFLASAET